MLLQEVQKSQQNCCQYAKQKLMGESHKINKRTSGFLVCQVIISLAKRFSSKFHICPQSLVSWPNTNFFGQYLSSIHYQPIYQLPEGV